MGRKRILIKEICDYCSYSFDKRLIKHKARDINICIHCVKKVNLWREKKRMIDPNKKNYAYPQRPYVIQINEEKVDREALKQFYSILGFDPEKDIHKQFMEKHNL